MSNSQALPQGRHRVAGVPLSTRLRGVALLAVLALALLLATKIEFKNPDSNEAFYVYGVMVTTVVFVVMTVSLAFYRDPAAVARARVAAGDTQMKDPLISCIVAVHNEEKLVSQCILSILGQTYGNTEVIVVDDASTDGTVRVLRGLRERYHFRLVELPVNRGKKGALAAGLWVSRGSIIAFADSDTVWKRDALAYAAPIFDNDPDVGAVSGHCRALNSNVNFFTKVQDTWYEGQFSVRKAFESVFGAVTCVSGPLALFRRSAIYNFIRLAG